MKNLLLLLILFQFPVFSAYCQITGSVLEYAYDNSGNRKTRRVIYLNTRRSTPSDTSLLVNEDIEKGFSMSLDDINIRLYPNPVLESLYLEIEGEIHYENVNYRIMDINGRIIEDSRIGGSHSAISFSGISNGSYVLRVYTEREYREYKVVKN